MSGKTLALSALLWMMVTPYRQERLSLPITHAAESQAQPITNPKRNRSPRLHQPPTLLASSPAPAAINLSFCAPKTSARLLCRYV